MVFEYLDLSINDELLSALSNDGNLSKAFTQAQNAVSGKVKSIFDQGKLLFGELAIIVLAIMGFMHFASGVRHQRFAWWLILLVFY